MTFIEVFLISLAVFAVIGGVVTAMTLFQMRNSLMNDGKQEAERDKSQEFYRNRRGW